jgi:transposase
MGTDVENSKDAKRIAVLEAQVQTLTQQLEWFNRQLFGRKSEKRLVMDSPHQPLLDGLLDPQASPPSPESRETITYSRRKGKQRGEDCVTDEGLRFDASVPVETIELSAPQLHGPDAEEYEVIAHKTTRRLAQRPATYVVLEYVRPVIKRKSTGKMMTVPAPSALWEGTIADVSVVAGLIEDKCVYYLPLYRQHQRMARSGVTVSRAVLSTWVHRAAELLRPLYDAQLRSILRSKTLAMDETAIKAGRNRRKGKMHQAWLWPVYGDADEIAFTFSPNRGRAHVLATLGAFEGTLLCDGLSAYEHYAATNRAVTHAQCWAHTRRYFERAQNAEPEAVAEALELIGELYRIEKHIRKQALAGGDKRAYRVEHARPAVEAFFKWCDEQCQRLDLLPNNPLAKALTYAMQRRAGLGVYLTDPELQIDTNHLEREIRPVTIGRKNWMFCWTEVGAERLAILHSLTSTCRLHGVHPYTYLVDVLQRISTHPDNAVEELIPRRWKELFASKPLRSDLAFTVNNVAA